MARCETCGNDYDKAFEITAAGESHIFDSFECAIQAMAPECAHCGCKIIGHGIEGLNLFIVVRTAQINRACAKPLTGPMRRQRDEP